MAASRASYPWRIAMADDSELRLLSESPACVHHWVLAEPVAGVVAGRCRRCGGERAFPATPEGTERFDDYRELAQSRSYYEARRAG
jgi:hypothetical protein